MLIINLFGAPGAGKSTGAAYVFSQLKAAGVNAELVTEFAKDKVWEGTKAVFENQAYIFGKQYFRISRLEGKVDVVITDSPILLSAFYNDNDHVLGEEFDKLVFKVFDYYNRIDVFVHRVKPYNEAGRFQTEEESDAVSKEKLIDLTDRTFDMLTVIKRVEDRKPGRPMWLCQCECGNTVVVSSTNLLRTNSTKSCGCLRHTSSPTLIDLRGKTFGKLKVIEKDPDSKPGKAKWICECKCGNIVPVLSDSLRNGKTRSCGCARSQIKHDLTNQTFGFLKVIEPVKNERIKGNETRWKCLCQNCGRTVEVSSYWLRHSDPYGHCKCTRFNKPL